jgi:perosamine synthetase
MQQKIKLFDPIFDSKEEKTLKNVLWSHNWASGSGVGTVSKFEKKFQKYVGSDSCVAVNSGTAALHLALSNYNIKNKEVILPSLSFVSTAHAIIMNGGKPIFVDVDPKTLCLDVEQLSKSITKKTKAVLPVHFGGYPCDMDKILQISKENKLILIEDAAHAVGTSYKEKKIGSHGHAVCFSFHPVKNLAMPGGGLISINDKAHKKLTKNLHAKRWCGITNRKGSIYDVKELGFNYYMNEFSASIGLIQLKKLEKMNNMRKKISQIYHKKLNLEKKIPMNNNCSYHLFWIQVKNRKNFMNNMSKKGIETGIHYIPIHKMTMYSSAKSLPETEHASKNLVSIPCHPNLTSNDIEHIVTNVNKFSE